MEDQNFALFNYVNELNNEIEFVQEQIQEVYNHYNSNVIKSVVLLLHLDTARNWKIQKPKYWNGRKAQGDFDRTWGREVCFC